MFGGVITASFAICFIAIIGILLSIIEFIKIRKAEKKLIVVKFRKIKIVLLVVCLVWITVLIVALAVTIECIILQNSFNAIPVVMEAIADDGPEICDCYVKCGQDSDNDNKCSYELLFGEEEYNKLVTDALFYKSALNSLQSVAMLGSSLATSENVSENVRNTLTDNTVSGKNKSEILIDLMNDRMVADYRNIVGVNDNFKSVDGKDRTKMSDAELKKDLIALLSDYKEGGFNPNCDICKRATYDNVNVKCTGESPYVEGYTWEALWEEDDRVWKEYYDGYDSTSSSGGTGGFSGSYSGGQLGRASAGNQYVIRLEDGNTYYWYHQKQNDNCANCGYGTFSYSVWGSDKSVASGRDKYHALSIDGCAVYSIAMAVSCLSNQAYTPGNLLADLGCTVTTVSGQSNVFTYDTMSSAAFDGRNIKYNPVLAKLESYGIHSISTRDPGKVREYLNNPQYDALYWAQWAHGPSPWYNGNAHFMVLRKVENTGSGYQYYCLTSSGCNNVSPKDLMNTPIDEATVFSHIKSAGYILFVYKNQTGNLPGGSYGPSPSTSSGGGWKIEYGSSSVSAGTNVGTGQILINGVNASDDVVKYYNVKVTGARAAGEQPVEVTAGGIKFYNKPYKEGNFYSVQVGGVLERYGRNRKGWYANCYKFATAALSSINGNKATNNLIKDPDYDIVIDGNTGFPIVAVGPRVVNPQRPFASNSPCLASEMSYGTIIDVVFKKGDNTYFSTYMVGECKAHSYPDFVMQTGYAISDRGATKNQVCYTKPGYGDNYTTSTSEFSKDIEYSGSAIIEFLHIGNLVDANQYEIQEIIVYGK